MEGNASVSVHHFGLYQLSQPHEGLLWNLLKSFSVYRYWVDPYSEEEVPGSQGLQWLGETPALKHKVYISLVNNDDVWLT